MVVSNDRIEELKGRIKEGAGRVTGDERLEAEGDAQATVARADRKLKGAKREAGGVVKETVGKILGDPMLEAKGKVERRRGKAQRTP